MEVQTIWYVPRGSYTLMLPVTTTFMPSLGLMAMRAAVVRHITQLTTASWSLSEKYQCPVDAGLKPETSPSTVSPKNDPSRVALIRPVSSLTLSLGSLPS